MMIEDIKMDFHKSHKELQESTAKELQALKEKQENTAKQVEIIKGFLCFLFNVFYLFGYVFLQFFKGFLCFLFNVFYLFSSVLLYFFK